MSVDDTRIESKGGARRQRTYLVGLPIRASHVTVDGTRIESKLGVCRQRTYPVGYLLCASHVTIDRTKSEINRGARRQKTYLVIHSDRIPSYPTSSDGRKSSESVGNRRNPMVGNKRIRVSEIIGNHRNRSESRRIPTIGSGRIPIVGSHRIEPDPIGSDPDGFTWVLETDLYR